MGRQFLSKYRFSRELEVLIAYLEQLFLKAQITDAATAAAAAAAAVFSGVGASLGGCYWWALVSKNIHSTGHTE